MFIAAAIAPHGAGFAHASLARVSPRFLCSPPAANVIPFSGVVSLDPSGEWVPPILLQLPCRPHPPLEPEAHPGPPFMKAFECSS